MHVTSPRKNGCGSGENSLSKGSASNEGNLAAQVEPETGRVMRTVSKHDGLVDNEAWVAYSLAVGEDGTVYFATPKGLSLYRPQLDRGNPLPPVLELRQAELEEDHSGHNEVVFGLAGVCQIRWVVAVRALRTGQYRWRHRLFAKRA